MSTAANKPATSLPPISDILRAPAVHGPYFPPHAYGSFSTAPLHPNPSYGSAYQLATPKYVAPRYYSTHYAAPSYSFAGETGYGPARDSHRDLWSLSFSAPQPFPSLTHLQHRQFGPPGNERVSPSSDMGLRSPEVARSHSETSSPRQGMAETLGHTKGRTRNNLPKEVTQVLLLWLNDHLSHPYPNSFEKAQLIMATGLNQQQLSNWFINARRRKIKLLREKRSSQ